MSGPDAAEAVISDLAKGLMHTFASKPVRPSVSESQLREFMDGKLDLSPEVKQQLAEFFYTGPVVFDAERDRLISEPPVVTTPPTGALDQI